MDIKKKLLKPIDKFSWEGNSPESIILHTTGGTTLKGAIDTLKARGLSYHFIIDVDGSVYQLVDIKRSAWHAGVVKLPRERAKKFFKDVNPNKMSVGIAFVNNPQYATDSFDGHKYMLGMFSNKQAESCMQLIKYIGQQTGVRYNANNIFTHHDVRIDKPAHVYNFQQNVLDILVGEKDQKDEVKPYVYKKTLMEKIVSLLNQILALSIKV